MTVLFSMQFVLFLLILSAAYYVTGRLTPRFQWCVLLVGSLVFYAFSGLSNIAYILTTAFSTWLAARLIAQYPKLRRVFLWATLLLNFGILAILKYCHFLFQPGTSILLPLGISFFTFQSMGYLIDIYNRKYEAEQNPFRYLLFISFFPQLIQGPIGRYNLLADSLYTPKRSLSLDHAKVALRQILFGLMKKYALANMLADAIAYVLDAPTADTPGSLYVFAILLYSVQQYADFSGGIDLVIGVARLFEVNLTPNFRQPYFSTSLADFWRRWHISLGTWMKDYVFYPFALLKPMQKLGKATKKRFGKHLGRSIVPCIANILVFSLVGIWHGSALHYLYWGLYNGIIIALSDLLAPVFVKIGTVCRLPQKSRGFHVFRVLRTFLIVNIGWYLDRIVSTDGIRTAFVNTVFHFEFGRFREAFQSMMDSLFVTQSLNRYVFYVAGAALLIVIINSCLCEREPKRDDPAMALSMPLLAAAALLLVLVSLTLVSAKGGFLYANF